MVYGRTTLLGGAFAAAAFLAAAIAAPAFAQSPLSTFSDRNTDAPILLRADEISQDQELGIVVARGSVEITTGERVVLADTLSYNLNAKTVTASGNVRLLEPDGTVLFAEFMELSEDLLEGTIENLRILLQDNARLAANGARRSAGNRTELARGVYSACEACRENPERPLLWQVKAERVIHDQAAQEVEYKNAFLELFGMPVFYTPYFSHPDPTVERRSGFLVPSFGTKTDTGIFLRTPYFIDIDDSQDITLDPIFTQEQVLIGGGEYRRAFDNGLFELSGSITRADLQKSENGRSVLERNELRGHVFLESRFDLNETWTSGVEVERVTDKTYFRKFDFWDDPGNFTTSRAYLEGYRGRNFASVEALSFQELRAGEEGDTPEILPLITYSGLGEADRFGGRWSFDAAARALTDNDDADSQMLSLDAGYRAEIINSFGLVNTFNFNLRGDVYHVDHLAAATPERAPLKDGVTGRLVPSLGYTASYPFVRYSMNGRQVIEPIVAAYLSPNGGNPSRISNIDSLVFETDYIGLFDQNRVSGLDRVETGPRVVAGLNLTHYQDNGGHLSAFIGNSYRFREDASLRDDLNLRAGQSDYVGFVEVSPNKFIDLGYRFNVSSDDLRANRNEIYSTVGGAGLQVSAQYTFVRDTVVSSSPEVEELALNASSQLNEFWSVRAGTLQDLRDNGSSLSHNVAVRYEDECFILDGSFRRNFFVGQDISPADALLFNLTFKTLGEVQF